MKNISIKWKIFLFLLGFCAILLMFLWLFQVAFLDSFYKSIKIKEIKSSSSAIKKNIGNEDILQLMKQISSDNEVCIEILSENGDTLYSADILRECVIHKLPFLDKQLLTLQAKEKGGELLVYFNRESLKTRILNKSPYNIAPPTHAMKAQESIIYTNIITNEGKTWIIMLNSLISPVNATVTTLRTQLYYITFLMVIFSVLLAFIIAKKVSKPIEKINESAKILAKGSYNTVFLGSGYKEINELSDTLNYTAKELSKVDSLRKELIANVSHDLRTPLTLINGYAEAMRDLPGENNADNAQVIIDETSRLTTLVNDVLDISRLQSGTQSISPIKYNLTNNIKEMINRIGELVRKDGYNLKFIYTEEVFVVADEARISQVIYNLLINAINYTGNDKTITVRQTVKSNKVTVEIKDTGDGIEEANLPYIWDRYYKVDKTHKRPVTGTGLGLSIVRSVIDLHGGEYGVFSKKNQGSTFWFSLKTCR